MIVTDDQRDENVDIEAAEQSSRPSPRRRRSTASVPSPIRELALVGVWVVAFVVSFFSIYADPSLLGGRRGRRVGLDGRTRMGAHDRPSDGRRVPRSCCGASRRTASAGSGSLAVDQFASVAFSVSTVVWLTWLWANIGTAIERGAWAVQLGGLGRVLPDARRRRPDRLRPAHPGRSSRTSAAVPRSPRTATRGPSARSRRAPLPLRVPSMRRRRRRDAAAARRRRRAGRLRRLRSLRRPGGHARRRAPRRGRRLLGAGARPRHLRAGRRLRARQQAFWALAPEERDVVDESGIPIFRVGPTAWALVIEDRGEAFVVRHEDGRIGYLHDVTGVTRG